MITGRPKLFKTCERIEHHSISLPKSMWNSMHKPYSIEVYNVLKAKKIALQKKKAKRKGDI